MDFLSQFSKKHLNGTIYLKTLRKLDEKLQTDLESGAGEIYLLFRPPFSTFTIEDIARVAGELGEIFVIRYKVDFHSKSRGYAFLQYIDASLQMTAVRVLGHRFLNFNMHVLIYPSRNMKELVLRMGRDPHQNPTPYQVYQQMRTIYDFNSVRVYEYRPGLYMYIFAYVNNDMANQAHRTIRDNIGLFGPAASISWLRRNQTVANDLYITDCCQELDKRLMAPHLETCKCFGFSFSPKRLT